MKLKYTNLDYDLINCKDLLIELDELPSEYNLNGLRVVGYKQSSLDNLLDRINNIVNQFNTILLYDIALDRESIENLRDNISIYLYTCDDNWERKDVKVKLEIKNNNITINDRIVTEEQCLKYINSKISNITDRIHWFLGDGWGDKLLLIASTQTGSIKLYLLEISFNYSDIVNALDYYISTLVLKPTVEKTTTLLDITEYHSNSGEEGEGEAEGEEYEEGEYEGEGEGEEGGGTSTRRYLKKDFLFRYVTDIRFSEEPDIDSDWTLDFYSNSGYIRKTNDVILAWFENEQSNEELADKDYIFNDFLNDFVKKHIKNGNFLVEETSNNTEILDQLCSLIQVKYLDYE